MNLLNMIPLNLPKVSSHPLPTQPLVDHVGCSNDCVCVAKVQSVDFFGRNKIGFVKLKSEIYDRNWGSANKWQGSVWKLYKYIFTRPRIIYVYIYMF